MPCPGDNTRRVGTGCRYEATKRADDVERGSKGGEDLGWRASVEGGGAAAARWAVR